MEICWQNILRYFAIRRFWVFDITVPVGCILIFSFVVLSTSAVPVQAANLYAINNSTCGETDDNLELTGEIVTIARFDNKTASQLSSEFFENYVLEVEVDIPSGECLGKQRFYIKKGIDVSGFASGDYLEFKINKNECVIKDILVIIRLDNHRVQYNEGHHDQK